MRSLVSRVRSRAVLPAVLALTLALAVAAPAAALASPLANLDVTLLLQAQGSTQPLLLVSGQLPEGTTLPAEIALPIPPGFEVAWSGEIFGGPVEDDPFVEARIEERDGGTVAVFTLTQSLVGQVEGLFPGATAPVEGDRFSGGFSFVSPVDVERARLAVGLPPGFQAASLPDGVLTSEGDGGMVYYYSETGAITAGGPLAFSMEYTGAPVSQGAVPSAPTPDAGEVPFFLIVIIAGVLGGAVLLVLVARKSGAGDTDPGSAEERPRAALASGEPVESRPAMAAPHQSASAPAAPAAGWLTPKVLVVLAAVLILGIVLAINVAGGGSGGGQVGVTETSGTLVSQRISTAQVVNETEYSLVIQCSCPPETEALKMFDALRQVPGVAHAALDTTTLVMRIGYDPEMVQESSIAERLKAAGYLY